jgi:hypothetical protein
MKANAVRIALAAAALAALVAPQAAHAAMNHSETLLSD